MPWYRVTWYSPCLRIIHFVVAEDEDHAVDVSSESFYDEYGWHPEDIGLEFKEVIRTRKPAGVEEEEEEGWGEEAEYHL